MKRKIVPVVNSDKVCQKLLRSLPSKAMGFIQIKFIKQLLSNNDSLPMHCALAILKLETFELKEKKHDILMRHLSFSGLLTVSVLMQMEMEDEWFKWNAAELNNSLSLTGRTVMDMVYVAGDQHQCPEPTGLFVYHALRVFKVLVEKGVLNDSAIIAMVSNLMNEWKNSCLDKFIDKQPLFIKLEDYITNHFCE